MSSVEKIHVPKSALKLAQAFPVALYIVGGKVRNHLMKIENDDIDLCSSLTLSQLDIILDKIGYEQKFKNESLGTSKIICGNEVFDYATLREESYPEGGVRQPKKVEFVESIEDDYQRRDFSINALYYNIKTGEYFDFCGGLNDLRKKTIKCVNEPWIVLKDDGIRILRMVRIACELKFKIDKKTFFYAQRFKANLSKISGVKLASELVKICDSSFVGVCDKKAYLRGIKLLNKLKAWKEFGLSFEKLRPNMVKKSVIKYIGLLIDIVDSERPASVSYFLNNLFDKLQIEKKKKQEMINVLSGYYDALNKIPNKIYFSKYFDNFEKIYQILLNRSKSLAQKYNFFYKYIISHKIVVKTSDLKVTNRDIAKHFPSLPRKSYNIILNMILSDIFEGKYSNDTETILKEIDKKLKYY